MAIEYGTPGYKYFKDDRGKLFALRDYWRCEKRSSPLPFGRGPIVSIIVKNDAIQNEWYWFNPDDYLWGGEKRQFREAQEKADELNVRDKCVIPCTIVNGREDR